MKVEQFLSIAGILTTALLGLLGAWWGKRLSRKHDDALTHKTQAEAVSIEVSTARGLVEDVTKIMNDQRAELAVTRSELKTLAERVRYFEAQQMVLISALAAHAPWDEAAWAALRVNQPHFPPPPPIEVKPDDPPSIRP